MSFTGEQCTVCLTPDLKPLTNSAPIDDGMKGKTCIDFLGFCAARICFICNLINHAGDVSRSL